MPPVQVSDAYRMPSVQVSGVSLAADPARAVKVQNGAACAKSADAAALAYPEYGLSLYGY